MGQGLAGSTLVLQLLERGKTVLVFDEPDHNRSSAIAAGLYNPITGKIMTRTWLADLLFPYLIQFYQDCEQRLQQKFFYPQPLYRPFVSIEEQNEWMGKSADKGAHQWVENVFTQSHFEGQVRDPFGGILLKQCGYLDVHTFMRSVSEFLSNRESYYLEHFDFSQLEVTEGEIIYRGNKAGKIIFCTGVGDNPYFQWLPVRPLKGETQLIALQETPKAIFNRGVYIVPTQSGNFKVGATYQPNDVTASITPSGQQELEAKLNALLKIPYKVVEGDWGIRPTSPDRRPMLGGHPRLKNVAIFNGLGTKGVSLAPYFSAQMANWLTGRGEILKEVNINRFKSLYSKS